MSDIYNTRLIDLLPPNLRNDPDIIAASAAADTKFQSLAAKINKVLVYTDIDNDPSEVMDNLAAEMNTDYYDLSLPLDTRRNLVKNTLIQKMTRGTPSAIEKLVTTLFGEGTVEEWFEYDGEPFYFRVLTENSAVTGEQADAFARAIEAVKRRSAWLEAVIVSMTGEMNIYFGNVLHTGDNITIEQVV